MLEFVTQKEGYQHDSLSKDVFAYISDSQNENILIFDWKRDISYQKSALQMKQNVENFKILNDSVKSLRSGIRGLALQSYPNLKVNSYIFNNMFNTQFS